MCTYHVRSAPCHTAAAGSMQGDTEAKGPWQGSAVKKVARGFGGSTCVAAAGLCADARKWSVKSHQGEGSERMGSHSNHLGHDKKANGARSSQALRRLVASHVGWRWQRRHQGSTYEARSGSGGCRWGALGVRLSRAHPLCVGLPAVAARQVRASCCLPSAHFAGMGSTRRPLSCSRGSWFRVTYLRSGVGASVVLVTATSRRCTTKCAGARQLCSPAAHSGACEGALVHAASHAICPAGWDMLMLSCHACGRPPRPAPHPAIHTPLTLPGRRRTAPSATCSAPSRRAARSADPGPDSSR